VTGQNCLQHSHWLYGWLDIQGIGVKYRYWAVVRAEGSLFSSIFLHETFYLYRALVAGQTQQWMPPHRQCFYVMRNSPALKGNCFTVLHPAAGQWGENCFSGKVQNGGKSANSQQILTVGALKIFRRRRWKLAFRSQRRLKFLAKLPDIFDIVNSLAKKMLGNFGADFRTILIECLTADSIIPCLAWKLGGISPAAMLSTSSIGHWRNRQHSKQVNAMIVMIHFKGCRTMVAPKLG